MSPGSFERHRCRVSITLLVDEQSNLLLRLMR
jgi:hypothetical protein